MPSLLIAEHDHNSLNMATAKALTAALALGHPVDVLVAGHHCQNAAEAARRLAGVARIKLVDDALYAHHLAEPMAGLIARLGGDYEAIIAPGTTMGKNIMPRVAALLDVMQISDITKVISSDRFERPIYAGNAIQTIKTKDKVKVITVRTASFAPAGEGGEAVIEVVSAGSDPKLSFFVGEERSASDRPELAAARIVISGGRALQSADNFARYIEPLANRLGAAIGASRAAVDAGYAPNDWQVGQTGKSVSPDLYIAVGISGAIQHLAGIKDAKIIVAINKDADAPIFQVADYGLVADLFTALPELEQELSKM